MSSEVGAIKPRLQSTELVRNPKEKSVDSKGGHITQNELPQVAVPTCDDRLLWDVWTSLFHLPALTVADELGLFSFLHEAPAAVEEITKRLSLQMRPTEALLGVLASLGFLVQHQGRFYITEVSRNFLLPESPFYWGGMLKAFQDLPNMHVLIQDTLKRNHSFQSTNDTTETSNCVRSLWGDELNPEQATFITQVMHSHSFPAAMGVARWGNFAGVRRLLDIAGGSGCFCIALAMQYPEMHFTILELPSVCRLTTHYITDYRLQHRIDTVAADMFTSDWPSGHDAVFFSNIFHDWDREHCLTLGQKSFEILPPGGRIYIHELLLADTRDSPRAAASYSMAITAFYGNKLFTAEELENLLRDCTFEDVSITPTYGYYSLISGTKR